MKKTTEIKRTKKQVDGTHPSAPPCKKKLNSKFNDPNIFASSQYHNKTPDVFSKKNYKTKVEHPLHFVS